MADAVGAGHEDHRRRCHPIDVSGIVTGTRDDVAMGVAASFGSLAHRGDAAAIELGRRRPPDLPAFRGKAERGADLADRRFQLGLHLEQRLVARMAQIDGEERAAGNGVARAGADLDDANRRHARRMGEGDAIDAVDDARAAEHRVFAAVHRRGAGVALAAGDRHLEPADALDALHDADGLAFGLEDRPLLDMRLEIGAELAPAGLLRAEIADAPELLAHGLAVEVGTAVAVGLVEHAGEHARADHGRGEAGAFLVGPHDDLDRRVGLVAAIVERADDLEPSEHAIDAVEAAAGRLRVEVAAGDHRRELAAPAGAAGEDVAHAVDGDGAAGLPAPAHEEIAPGAVEVAERQSLRAAFLGGADLSHQQEALPQALLVDAEVLHRQGVSFSTAASRPKISSICALMMVSGGDSAMMSPVVRTSSPLS